MFFDLALFFLFWQVGRVEEGGGGEGRGYGRQNSSLPYVRPCPLPAAFPSRHFPLLNAFHPAFMPISGHRRTSIWLKLSTSSIHAERFLFRYSNTKKNCKSEKGRGRSAPGVKVSNDSNAKTLNREKYSLVWV